VVVVLQVCLTCVSGVSYLLLAEAERLLDRVSGGHCVSGVSYLLPAEAERLLDIVKQKHEEQQMRLSAGRQQHSPVIDEKHRQFIDDIVSVSAQLLHSL